MSLLIGTQLTTFLVFLFFFSFFRLSRHLENYFLCTDRYLFLFSSLQPILAIPEGSGPVTRKAYQGAFLQWRTFSFLKGILMPFFKLPFLLFSSLHFYFQSWVIFLSFIEMYLTNKVVYIESVQHNDFIYVYSVNDHNNRVNTSVTSQLPLCVCVCVCM